MDVSARYQSRLDALLERIEASPGFPRGGNLIRFLRYAAVESLEGRGKRVKEYTVAVEVFGRPSSYDPQVDSLVRVQASLLRTRLEQYYASGGRNETVIIEIPKGGYQVNFVTPATPPITADRPAVNGHPVALPAAEPASQPVRTGHIHKIAAITAVLLIVIASAIWLGRSHPTGQTDVAPSIAVLPFVDMSPGGDQSFLGDGIADELIHALGGIPGLRVVARTSAFQYKSKAQDILRIGRDLNVSYVVEGSVRRERSTLRVTAELINASTGYQAWSAAYQRKLDDLLPVEEEIAQAIAASLRTRQPSRPTRLMLPAMQAWLSVWPGYALPKWLAPGPEEPRTWPPAPANPPTRLSSSTTCSAPPTKLPHSCIWSIGNSPRPSVTTAVLWNWILATSACATPSRNCC